MAILARKQNSKGVTYSLQQHGDMFSVWKLCGNYCPHSAGGMRYVWRYIERNMPRDAAEALFEKRSK